MTRFLHTLFFIIALYFCVSRAPLYAHTLQNIQGRTIVLHVDPDDDPVIGKPAKISFEIDSPEGAPAFNTSECDCRITITTPASQNTRVILDKALQNTESTHSIFALETSFTFPEKNIYTITLTATPRSGAKFQAFVATFPLRVEREDGAAPTPMSHITHSVHFLHILIFGGFFLGMIIWLSIGQYRHIQARKMEQK